MKDIIKEIKNAEGKTIEYQYLNDKFVPSFYHQIYHEIVIEKIKKLYFNAIAILQIKDNEIYDKLSNLKTYHTHSFKNFYYYLLSLYDKDLDTTQDKLPIEFNTELLEKLYYQTSFYKFDSYSQKFSIDRKDYDEIIY